MKIVCRNAHNSKCNNFINDCLILSYIFLSKKSTFLVIFQVVSILLLIACFEIRIFITLTLSK